jgi:hypothetical protein
LRMLGMHREVAATALPQNVQAEVEEMVRPRS